MTEKRIQIQWVKLLLIVIGVVGLCTMMQAHTEITQREIMYVDAANTGMQDGCQDHPFITINQALETGALEIRVAEGTYTETVDMYSLLHLKGGYQSGTWDRDWEQFITTISADDWAAVYNSQTIAGTEISGFHITGAPQVTYAGVWFHAVSGPVLIQSCRVHGLYAMNGMHGEDCYFGTVECPNLDGEDGDPAYGIYATGLNIEIINTTVTDIHGGTGGNGGTWNYAAGHTDGGDSGDGGDAYGIYTDGTLTGNTVYAVYGGWGGNGGSGFDDTGYGGDGGYGGNGGIARGIYVNSAEVVYNNLIHMIIGGRGGNGGSGTWNASPARGGDGGKAEGFHQLPVENSVVEYLTIENITAGNGGSGGNWYQYMGSSPIAGAVGGNGGIVSCAALEAGLDEVIFRNNIVVSGTAGSGGNGGSGDPNGSPGTAGLGYGISHYTPGRSIVLETNNVWNHTTASYYGMNPGTGDISANPEFVAGPDGDYYLSQIAAGQGSDSPCVDAGTATGYPYDGTTRTDEAPDTGAADMGFHYGSHAPEPTPTPVPCINSGDVDGNGTLTPADSLVSFQIYLTMYPNPTQEEWCAADCNGSQDVTPADALCIFQNYVSGACACVDPVL